MSKFSSVVKGTWRFFTSMSLGLALLCFLILFSILGTFNPGLFMSPWFLSFSALLTVNLLGCTCQRLQGLWKETQRVPALLHQEGKHRLLILENLELDPVRKVASEELRRLGFHLGRQQTGPLLTAKRHAYAKWGSPLLHLAMILVIIGSMVGTVWGKETFVQVEVPGKARLTQEGFPFDLEIKKFHMDTYEDGTPKQYTSRIGLISANQIKLEKDVSVNHPLSHQGVKIYQTSYGYTVMGAVREEQRSFDFKIEEGEKVYLGGPGQFELAVEWPRYYVYSQGIPFTMGIAELGEPIKLLNIEVVLTNRLPFTGLQVKKDPGLPFIWAGFMLFLVALPLRLYVKPQQIWLLLTQGANGVEVRLAAQHRLRSKEQEEQLLEKLSGLIPKECSIQT